MSLIHSHADGHGHHHHHDRGDGQTGRGGPFLLRVLLALLCVIVAITVASFIPVQAGEADGDDALRATGACAARARPRVASAGADRSGRAGRPASCIRRRADLQDVGTRDGLRIIVQAYVAWRVPADPNDVGRFVRAVGNEPDEAARQIRSLLGSALQTTSADFRSRVAGEHGSCQGAYLRFRRRLRRQIDSQLYRPMACTSSRSVWSD